MFILRRSFIGIFSVVILFLFVFATCVISQGDRLFNLRYAVGVGVFVWCVRVCDIWSH